MSSTLPGLPFKHESLVIENGDAPITLNLAWQPTTVPKHPVILMLGSLKTNQLPEWSTNLVNEGYMLVAFTAAHSPDPDPARRPQWLYFDQRFAHSYVQGAQRAISDSRTVINYLARRGDIEPEKIGWLGSSSTGIPGLAVATQGPRLAAVVAFVSTGAYCQWFDTWQPNGLWKGQTNSLWPETETLLRRYDPILHAEKLFPTPVLMVSGGEDKVVDPKTARAFVEAARPAYKSDPERLRLVVYEGFGHNLPSDVVRLFAEHWFHLYMNPAVASPRSASAPSSLGQSVIRSQINATDHQKLLGASGEERPTPDRASAEEHARSGVGRSNNLPSQAQPVPSNAENQNLLKSAVTKHAGVTEWISVSSNKRGFVTASSGKKFTPWGFNYDRDYKMRLLEDYWEAEWSTVVEDFREMKQLGANVVRVHLQFAKFMDAPDLPNVKSLKRLAQLAKVAEETGLYLDLTGLACYRKQDVPAWYASLGEPDRWRAQARFWEAIATNCAASPAIFCYDLINEPFVPNDPRPAGDWLAGQLAGFYYLQTITLDPAGRSRSAIARYWITNLTAAIRKHDQRHLVTVGFLPTSTQPGPAGSGFVPREVAGPLDFISVHMYPNSAQLKEDLVNLKTFQIGKPVVIEETFPMRCKSRELLDFLNSSKPDACGFISFYWGQTLAELKGAKESGDAMLREWLPVFQELAE